MVEINRALTPLELFVEDLRQPLALAVRQKQMVQRSLEESPAPFVIGSINTMNEKIQHLSGTLQAHPAALLVETRARDSAHPASTHPQRSRQQVVQKLPQIEEVKRTKSKHSRVKPKLVELQHYPGFNAEGPTPLPNDTALHQIWDNVLQAHWQQKKQTSYLAEFRQLLSSTLMQDILLDTFWWFFLNTYQTNFTVQCQLFDRISKNYVQLIMECKSWHYGDQFLQELSSSLSQSVYSSFCCSFPQSWIQFDNNDFKSQVCNIVYQWIGGKELELYTACELAHRVWYMYRWGYGVLSQGTVYVQTGGYGVLSQGMVYVQTGGYGVLSQGMVYVQTGGYGVLSQGSAVSLNDSNRSSRVSLASVSTRSSSTSVSSERSTQRKALSTSPKLSQNSATKEKINSRVKHMTFAEDDNCQIDEEPSDSSGSHQSVNKVTTSNYRFTRVSPHKQSHVAGRGPEFMKNLFNLFGLSPLVLNFLQRLNLEPRAGDKCYVTRTEIQRLPQDDAPTYNDVIEAGYQNLLKLKEMKEKLCQQQPKGRQWLAQSR
ncbi:protein FAM227A-like [Heptranchias perlo]|uniref:protein FAM227A-like n=1 Tax=Heptranchias perlo TaxID=212740 RepID=UPI0035598864